MQFDPLKIDSLISLDAEELTLTKNHHTEKSQLVFAIMLKFFQTTGRYPTKKDIIEPQLVLTLATQLGINTDAFDLSHFENRMIGC